MNTTAAVSAGSPRRVRLCAVAARDLLPGTVIKRADAVTRVRRIAGDAQYFADPALVEGRQLAARVAHGEVIAPSSLKADKLLCPVDFQIAVEPRDADALQPCARVVLIRAGGTPSAVFTVMEPLFGGKLALRADYAEDAFVVLKGTDDKKPFRVVQVAGTGR